MEKRKANGLTEKQVRFIAEYLIDFNGARSARDAGYSVKTAKEKAHELLSDNRIWSAINKEMQKRAKRTKITQDKVLYDLETQRQGAIKNRQYTAAMRGSELHGKHLAMFSDRLIHDATPEMIELASNLPQIMQTAEFELMDTLKKLAGHSGEVEEIKIEREKLMITKRKKRGIFKRNKRGNGNDSEDDYDRYRHGDKDRSLQSIINDTDSDGNKNGNANGSANGISERVQTNKKSPHLDPTDDPILVEAKKGISLENWKPY